MAVLIAAAALSLSAQVAEAKAGPTGWLLAAVPALAFLALSKLVLSRTSANPEGDTTSVPAENPTPPSMTSSSAPARAAAGPSASSTAAPALPTPEPAETPAPEPAELPAHLLTGARMAAFTHRQATGHRITAPALADHLGIPPQLAGTLIHALGDDGEPAEPTPAPITHVNGTATTGRL